MPSPDFYEMDHNVESQASILSRIDDLRRLRLSLEEKRLTRPDIVEAFRQNLPELGAHQRKRRYHTETSRKSGRSTTSSKTKKLRARASAPPTTCVQQSVAIELPHLEPSHADTMTLSTVAQQPVEIEEQHLEPSNADTMILPGVAQQSAEIEPQLPEPTHVGTITSPGVVEQEPMAACEGTAAHQSTVEMPKRGPCVLQTELTLTPIKVSLRDHFPKTQTPRKVVNNGSDQTMSSRGTPDKQSSVSGSVAPEVCNGAQRGVLTTTNAELNEQGYARAVAREKTLWRAVEEEEMERFVSRIVPSMGGMSDLEKHIRPRDVEHRVSMESFMGEKKFDECEETPENAAHRYGWKENVKQKNGVEPRHEFLVESESPELPEHTSEVGEKFCETPEVVSVQKIKALRRQEDASVIHQARTAVEKILQLPTRRERLEELKRRTRLWNKAIEGLRCKIDNTCGMSPRQEKLAAC